MAITHELPWQWSHRVHRMPPSLLTQVLSCQARLCERGNKLTATVTLNAFRMMLLRDLRA